MNFYIFLLLLLYIVFSMSNHPKNPPFNSALNSITRKRLMKELRDTIQQNLTLSHPFNTSNKQESGIRLYPVKGNLLEWHFSFTGMEESVYERGIYHGFILLDPSYPNKAPSIAILTPNGRWEVCKPICLSASAYHQETWDTNWTLRTLILSLRNFITTQPKEIGGIRRTYEERKLLADQSRLYYCPSCGTRHAILSGDTVLSPEISNVLFGHDLDIDKQIENIVGMTTKKKPKRFLNKNHVNNHNRLINFPTTVSRKQSMVLGFKGIWKGLVKYKWKQMILSCTLLIVTVKILFPNVSIIHM